MLRTGSATTIDVAAAASKLASTRLRQVLEADLRHDGATSVSNFKFHGLFQELRSSPGLSYEVGQPVYHQPSLGDNDAYPPFYLQTDIDYTNSGETADSFKVPVDATRRTSFTWSLTEGLKVGATAKTKVKIPFFGDSELDLSTEVSFGSTQSWTTETSQHWGFEATVSVPPRTGVRYSVNSKIVDAEITFEIPITLTCFAWAEMDGHGPKSNMHTNVCRELPHLLTAEENRWIIRGVLRGAIGHKIQVNKDFHELMPGGRFAAQPTHRDLEIRF